MMNLSHDFKEGTNEFKVTILLNHSVIVPESSEPALVSPDAGEDREVVRLEGEEPALGAELGRREGSFCKLETSFSYTKSRITDHIRSFRSVRDFILGCSGTKIHLFLILTHNSLVKHTTENSC